VGRTGSAALGGVSFGAGMVISPIETLNQRAAVHAEGEGGQCRQQRGATVRLLRCAMRSLTPDAPPIFDRMRPASESATRIPSRRLARIMRGPLSLPPSLV